MQYPYRIVLFHSSLLLSMPYHTKSYRAIPMYPIRYHTIPHQTTLYHTVPYRTVPYKYMYKIASTARRSPSAFLRRIFELLPCELAMRITPRPETLSSCSPPPTVSKEASDVRAPCPGCFSAALVFCKIIIQYVVCEFDQLSGQY